MIFAAGSVPGYILVLLLLASCAASPQQKIRFDLARLDSRGLYGHADGKRSLAYEFCVPDASGRLAAVLDINPALQCTAHSPGRLGCSEAQWLCIGDTHEPGIAALKKLAGLEFVSEIRETYFE